MVDSNVQYIPTNLIDNPGRDARLHHDQEEYADLLASVRDNGILQPLLVRPRQDRYELIAGNRRLHVARELGLAEVPALVRAASDYETAVYRLEENLKRSDLNVVEEAKYYAETLTALGISVADLAARIGRSEQWVNDRLAVAAMPDYLQMYLMRKDISLGVALALNDITDEKVRNNWAYYAATSGMSVLAARNALAEWQKMERRRAEAPEGTEPELPPIVPPTLYSTCERCGAEVEMRLTRIVRICNPRCSIDSSPS